MKSFTLAAALSLLTANQEIGIDERVEAILQKLTLEEKVGQMTQVTLDVLTKGPNVFASDEPLVLDPQQLDIAFAKYKVGSVLNTANNRARTVDVWNEIIGQIQQKAIQETGIPIIYGIDAIHGVTYTAGATFFPQQIGIAATWDTAFARKGSEITAYETRASAIPWNFSPLLDVARDPRWPRMWETYGEDVYLVAKMGEASIKGYEGPDNDLSSPKAVASTIKHFPAYGAERSGKDRTPTWFSEVQFREYFLDGYKVAIQAGAHSIMINSGVINGLPVHANPRLLTKLLREELGFKGVIVTDWADIENIHNRDKAASSHKEAVKLAINAGIDMSMVPYNFNFCDHLIALVKEGEVSMARIDDAVRRILRLKVELGLFEKPMPAKTDYPEFASAQAQQEAFNAAAESITLLKNKDNFLPLKPGNKLLVTGPNAHSMRTLNGGWSYSWQGEKVYEFSSAYHTIYDAIRLENGEANTTYVAGVSYKDDGDWYEEHQIDIDAAVTAAQGVDAVILCLGENSYTESVGNFNDLYISENQEKLALALIATGKPIVLVLNEGRPRLIRRFEAGMQAVIQAYLPGNYGGDALSAILFGQINPSGKLPYSYPKYPNALITYDYKPSEVQTVMDGVYNYQNSVEFQYPFGHGLSYTEFVYSSLTLDRKTIAPDEDFTVNVTVTNTGGRAGKEVVQLYTSDEYATITPDNKRLRGFEKIELQPGESRQVIFKLNGKDLSFVDYELHRITEEGKFIVTIGDESQTINVTKTKIFDTYNRIF
ncbi:glycoside hydrolase family 3 N-terminal domain-containing protein [Parapedobacter koreensis]|uniref:beta-glucosidase n=1 Tax=Parapedobacter koreensis TaxID=332977 RepID=A0A1H7GFY9_9SPHI|nr:glycoside hydrolase family 3 N-terminal domain-containing protein [Parapedobacter koreensis]SEK37039.1 beta-glucosidase [Parapedobacter koreensis]